MFTPTFFETDTVEATAIAINVPHVDDFPVFVAATARALVAIEDLSEITLIDALNIHAMIFADRGDIGVGTFRTRDVVVGDDTPVAPALVADAMEGIFPVVAGDDLIAFYTAFQTIHPFDDGNGRVGGVIVAALSNIADGVFLSPNQ